jgi:hypothetical protein
MLILEGKMWGDKPAAFKYITTIISKREHAYFILLQRKRQEQEMSISNVERQISIAIL